jgi:hypothetical protein
MMTQLIPVREEVLMGAAISPLHSLEVEMFMVLELLP